MKDNAKDLKLAQAVVSLRATNPSAWNTFMAMLADRLDEVTENMVSTTPDAALLAQAQGRALEARALFKQLSDAPALVDRMHDIEVKNGKAPR